MKCYEIVCGQAHEGITVRDDCIVLGETGRGRMETHVPLPPGSDVRNGRVYTIPSTRDGILICIRDHSGFRGSWQLTRARTTAEWDAIIARAHAHRPPYGDGALAAGHTRSGPCPACDAVAPAPPERECIRPLSLIAEGRRAQGIAGGMGGGPEYLMVLRDGEAYEICRTGRLYGRPAVYAVLGDRDTVIVYDPRYAAIDRLVWRQRAKLLQVGAA